LFNSFYTGAINVGKAKYDLVNLNRPQEDHIVLEALSKEQTKNNDIYILNFKDKNPLMIVKIKFSNWISYLNFQYLLLKGRSYDCDFKISDISVSRVHALLKNYKNMELYIEDCQSKFGTLIYNKKCFPLQYMGDNYSLQIGRTFLQISLFRIDKSISDICCKY
jgi:hypothetical protein